MHKSSHLKTFDLLFMTNKHILSSNNLNPKDLGAYSILLFGEMHLFKTT